MCFVELLVERFIQIGLPAFFDLSSSVSATWLLSTFGYRAYRNSLYTHFSRPIRFYFKLFVHYHLNCLSFFTRLLLQRQKICRVFLAVWLVHYFFGQSYHHPLPASDVSPFHLPAKCH